MLTLCTLYPAQSVRAASPTVLPPHNGFNDNPNPAKTPEQLGIKLFPRPPVGFNPLTATDADLAKYGFPQRPTNPEGLAAWKTAMENVKSFVENPLFKAGQYRTVPPTKPITTGTTNNISSNNWSGYLAYTSSATEVQGTFKVPDLPDSAMNQPDGATVSIWDGIGGWGNGNLIQAGIQAVYHDTSNGQWATYSAWWEALPDYPSEQTADLTVNPYDTMYVSCTYNPSTGYTSFYMEDETTGQVMPALSVYTARDYNGSTAEWIAERPEKYPSNSTYPYSFLADFGSDPFTGSTVVEGGTDYAIGNVPGGYNGIEMIDASLNNEALANVSYPLTTPSSFTDYWHNYGNQQN